MTRIQNDRFQPLTSAERGAGRLTETCWYLLKCLFFLSPLPWPSSWKVSLLRLFGARVGNSVYIKPRVNIHFPWKLAIGDHTWIGEEAFLLNFEPISIGSHCCISQRAFLCTGNHDYTQPDMPYRNRPLQIEDGVWIGAQAFVAPGITLHTDTVVTAGSVVTSDLPPSMICSGNPCLPVKPRFPSLQTQPTGKNS